MDVIGLDRQLFDVPAPFLALGFNDRPTVPRDGAREDRFPSLGTPDKVVEDKVNPVLISLVFHVGSICFIDSRANTVRRQSGLKPPESYRRLTTGSKDPWFAAG
jgi:hypothetical protein